MECIGVRTDRVVEANGEGIAQIARLLETHLAEHGEELRAGDVVVVSGKVCSVAEGLVLRSADIAASDAAKAIAEKFVVLLFLLLLMCFFPPHSRLLGKQQPIRNTGQRCQRVLCSRCWTTRTRCWACCRT